MTRVAKLQSVIKSILNTEKAYRLTGEHQVLTVTVDKNTNKVEVAQAAQSVFNTDVISVNILNVKGKTKNRGNRKGRRSDVKKAYIRVPAVSQSEIDAAAE